MFTPPETALAAARNDTLRLGFTPMDDTHEEFVELLAALLRATDADLPQALAAVHGHTREHFAAEERWMEETGFPGRECHRDEHAAVLASMEGVARRLATGDMAPARRLAEALNEWFPGHADHLDSALAHWMCKKHLGGKPVVLRRNVSASAGAAN